MSTWHLYTMIIYLCCCLCLSLFWPLPCHTYDGNICLFWPIFVAVLTSVSPFWLDLLLFWQRMSLFWIVTVLVSRCFGLLLFWLVAVLDLSPLWPVPLLLPLAQTSGRKDQQILVSLPRHGQSGVDEIAQVPKRSSRWFWTPRPKVWCPTTWHTTTEGLQEFRDNTWLEGREGAFRYKQMPMWTPERSETQTE